MTDKWFLQDIEHQLKKRKRVVILDPNGQCEFLLPFLESNNYTVLKTDRSLSEEWQTIKEELFLRNDAETKYKDNKVIFYVTREQSKLSFLFDYCFTHGCLDLSNPIKWLKDKIFSNTGLQVQKENAMILTAAKLGIGEDIGWWKKIIQDLEDLVSLEDKLLPFLNNPEDYLNSFDSDIRRLFEEKLFELLEQPYISKQPKTLANEIVKKLFDGLINNNVSGFLISLYYKWADSEKYRPSLDHYISHYQLSASHNIWAVHPDHCFQEIDKKILQQISENIRNKSYLSEKLNIIKVRSNSHKVKRYIPSWLQDIISLLEFDIKPLTACDNFDKVVTFYVDHFSKIDRAIRNLYVSFLQEETIIRPLQEFYESLNYQLLDAWYSFSNEYKSNQKGFLIKLFKKAKPGTAVIVCDGLRYEIADFVFSELKKQFTIEKSIMLADMPSETENNMSALYTDNNKIIPIHKDREKELSEITQKNIDYKNLESVNESINSEYTVLTYKDIDKAGETMQQGAIKLFQEFENVLISKIKILLNSQSIKEVYLVSDHGFVLTGLLDEADKIVPEVKGKKDVHERFIRTVEKQSNSDWLEFEKKYGDYNYFYIAKNHRPFKSKGVYGFSHGGFTPQEIIIPNFVFKKKKPRTSGLKVSIINKKDLEEVTGKYFKIKIQASASASDLFSSSRKVKILLFSDNINYSSSNIINIDADKSESIEFSINDESELQAALIDADSQKTLDTVKIKKSNLRDLGGLL